MRHCAIRTTVLVNKSTIDQNLSGSPGESDSRIIWFLKEEHHDNGKPDDKNLQSPVDRVIDVVRYTGKMIQ